MLVELLGYEDKKITPLYKERKPAPADVWNLRDYSTWRDDIWRLIDDFADTKVRSAFLASPPEYVVGDDLRWLDDLVYAEKRIMIDSKAELTERLRGHYRALRAVHGTRTSDLSTFYESGLKRLHPESFHDQAREVFLNGDYPELSEERLQDAITAVGSDLRSGRVYFEANETMLIDLCGHYMLYGSEYLICIAAHLGGSRDYRQILKARGVPTLFICDVPLDFIGEQTLQEFAGEALELVFQELLDGPQFRRDKYRGAGFCIYEDLPADCVVGHYHPTIRRDPFSRGY
jgi:hypothetical protein